MCYASILFTDSGISNCYVHDNFSWLEGGGIDIYQATLVIENSTISNNEAYHGGGINIKESDVIITNSTICDNFSDADGYGGGINIESGNPVYITNCTIVNNTSVSAGGGIAVYLNEIVLKNNILANNTGGGAANDFDNYTATVTDNGYNIVEFASGYTFSGTGDITGDQTLLNLSSTLADNNSTIGTPTLELSIGSVAIDTGNASANSSVSIPLIDQRGITRDSNIDIGAFEYYVEPIGIPQNVTTAVIGTDLELSWDAVSGATSYKVYSSTEPYGTYTEDTGGVLVDETWTILYTEAMVFYYVVAVDGTKK